MLAITPTCIFEIRTWRFKVVVGVWGRLGQRPHALNPKSCNPGLVIPRKNSPRSIPNSPSFSIRKTQHAKFSYLQDWQLACARTHVCVRDGCMCEHYARMYVCMYMYMYVCMYVCVYVCIYVCMHVCIYIYVQVNKYVCICMFVCVCM